jgi:general stress protein 26
MNSTLARPRVLARLFLLLCFAVLAPGIRGQVKPPPRLDRQSLIATAQEIMKTARYCALITLDSNGRPRARTMDPFSPDVDMVVWLATNPKSRKVAEIRRNQRVTLYYFVQENQAYVTIFGRAQIVDDAKERAKHWKEEWKDFYPDRHYLLIAVEPERLELVNVKQGIIGDSVTWRPAAVTFGRRKLK